MSKRELRGRYFESEELERLADELLRIYRRKSKSPLLPPIQADLVAESVGLNILWEELSEEPGTTACAEIRPDDRLIVVNERRRGLLDGTPGLYNTSVAHELGHWWLHVDHAALGHDELPGYVRSLPSPRRVDRRDERNAHEFMGYLLMPHSLLLPRAQDLNLQNWRGLYRLRQDFDVTITAMKIRLEKLGLT
ncbi:MAG: ImmA/IrrE family metallo-endopeptidase [Actinomycetota bacterium]|nr:ImmA/IrrE family metallo-endopeptidase [Actinomycetota bacterium]